jgi:hypothetical protein
MAVHYERDDARRRVVVTVRGAFQASDMLTVIERQRAENIWNYGTLFDLRGMAGHPTVADLRDLMGRASANPPAARRPGPVALLATEPMLYSRLCTYATLGQSKANIQVFRDHADAMAWLTAETNHEN